MASKTLALTNKIPKWLILLLGLTIVITRACGQSLWSLEDCIQYAKNNHQSLKKTKLDWLAIDAQMKLHKAKRQHPELFFSSNFGTQLGRNVDPTTNDFNNRITVYNGLSLESNYNLYDGGDHKIKGKIYNLQKRQAHGGAQYNLRQIEVAVFKAFAQYIYSLVKLEQAEVFLHRIEDELKTTVNKVKAGILAQVDLFLVQSRKARQLQTIRSEKEEVELNLNLLKSQMNMKSEEKLIISKELLEVGTIIRRTLQHLSQPSMRSKHHELNRNDPYFQLNFIKNQIIDQQIKLEEYKKNPIVSVFLNLYTNYSSQAIEVDVFGSELVSESVLLNGNPVFIESLQLTPYFKKVPVQNQLANNFGQNIGVHVTWPIGHIFTTNKRKQLHRIEKQVLLLEKEQYLKNQNQIINNIENNISSLQEKIKIARSEILFAEKSYFAIRQASTLGRESRYEMYILQNEVELKKINFITFQYHLYFQSQLLNYYYNGNFTFWPDK